MASHIGIDRDALDLWSVHEGVGAILGTAVHAGHGIRPEFLSGMVLPENERLREEDPFTEQFIADIPTRVIAHRSRFEFDLNRSRETAVYETPDQAWGLNIWGGHRPSGALVDGSRALHADYYDLLENLLHRVQRKHGDFIVLDVHSYNHYRDGKDGPPISQDKAPDINIGTFSMDREKWAHVVDPFMEALSKQTVKGQSLDVRENIAFQGKGEQTRFIHDTFPNHGCAIAVEFKKIFMNEFSGKPDETAITDLRRALTATLPVLKEALANG